MADATETDGGKAKKRRFDQRDFDIAAEQIIDDFNTRQRKRADLEQHWKEIDRQVRMEPDISFKTNDSGTLVPGREWMPEMELPLQAQTVEVLTADSRRMLFPDTGAWFISHAEMTDEYLDRVDLAGLITGDKNDIPSKIDQDAADKLVTGWLSSLRRQYDFAHHMDIINAEAFSYGVGVGRVRTVTKQVFMDTARGVLKEEKRLPVLFPRSIKNTYLDDSCFATMNEGYIVGPNIIFHEFRRFSDLVIAASKGSNDPDKENGGWMPKNIQKVEPDKNGTVELLEYEGDLVISRKTTRSMVVPGVIMTVVKGKKGARQVVRVRFRKQKFSSYIQFPYHTENMENPYATAPLMKGRPIHKAAVESLNRLMQAAILNTEPPIEYDKDNPAFVQSGGPDISPRALWPTNGVDAVRPHQIGDTAALFNVYIGLLQQYSDVTGINAPRLGAQTVSHTTAFSKEAELSRGVVRTVDYTRSTLKGPLTKFLHMEYEMAREAMGGREDTVYIEPYRGFVTLTKSALPDNATFDALGSGGPAEEQQKQARRLQAANFAIQLEGLKVANGLPPSLNIEAMQEQVMLDGGWIDIDPFFEGTDGADQGASVLPGAPGANAGPAAAVVQALQGTQTA
ncbi:MAG: hypothetical protein ACR2OV_15840 [Hyphomicrobiaceae bacterium]